MPEASVGRIRQQGKYKWMTEGCQLRSEAPKCSLELEYGSWVLQGKQQRELTLKTKQNKGEAESLLLT